MQAQMNIALTDLEKKRQAALDYIEAIYYTPTSPHYRDNERFTWAVETINKKYNQERKDLIEKFMYF
jgi:hypothetical protein